jgi:hypothetical protein
MPMDLSIFKTYRINLVRQNDLRHFPGFVAECDGSVIEVRTTEEKPKVGDLIAGQIIIHHRAASFVGIVRGLLEDGFNLEVTTPISLESTVQSARRELVLTETVIYDGKNFEVEIADVALEGIGLHTFNEFPMGAQLFVEIPGKSGPIGIPFCVKYCLPMPGTEMYKVGCQIDTSDAKLLSQYTLFLQSNDPLTSWVQKKAS